MTSPFDVDLATVRAREGKKWTKYGDDILAAWVADMDFAPAPPILDAIRQMVDRYDFGYSFFSDDERLIETFTRWMQQQHGWKVEPSRVRIFGDVLQGLVTFINLYSEPGDGVVLQTPIYPPFIEAVTGSGRTIVDNPLGSAAEGYRFDIEGLRAAITPTTKIIMMANPHNPTGRVFTPDELRALGELAIEHDLLVIADEIHADLVWEGTHTVFADLDPRFAERTVTFTSATKSFNIAGLRCAVGVMGSDAMMERFETIHRFSWGGVNNLGAAATMAAWTHCDEWLEGLRNHLRTNRALVVERINNTPGLSTVAPEATFLSWIDCSELIASGIDERPFKHFLHRGVAFNDGETFGPHGTNHVRLNFATSRAILEQVLDRL